MSPRPRTPGRHGDLPRRHRARVRGLLRLALAAPALLCGCDPGLAERDAAPGAEADLGAAAAADQQLLADAAPATDDAGAADRGPDAEPAAPDAEPAPPLAGNRMPSGFCYPSSKSWSGPMSWLLAYPKYPYPGKFHRGSDIGEKVGSKIYALADGEVVKNGTGTPEVFQKHLWMRFKLADGSWFYAVYGHVSSALQKGTAVKACDPLGQIEKLSWPHLHFGIHPAGVSTPWGMGKIPDGWDKDPATLPLNGWVMPWDYLQAHRPG